MPNQKSFVVMKPWGFLFFRFLIVSNISSVTTGTNKKEDITWFKLKGSIWALSWSECTLIKHLFIASVTIEGSVSIRPLSTVLYQYFYFDLHLSKLWLYSIAGLHTLKKYINLPFYQESLTLPSEDQ